MNEKETLFVFGSLKTGGQAWRLDLAPRIGVPDRLDGFVLYTVNRVPVIYKGDPSGCVYGERFEVDMTELHPGPYFALSVGLASGKAAWVYVPALLPQGVEPVEQSCYRNRELTEGLAELAEAILASGRERAEVMTIIRDQIRPLAQMNWVSIPWRTGVNTSEWRWCLDYVKRLAFAAEIGL